MEMNDLRYIIIKLKEKHLKHGSSSLFVFFFFSTRPQKNICIQNQRLATTRITKWGGFTNEHFPTRAKITERKKKKTQWKAKKQTKIERQLFGGGGGGMRIGNDCFVMLFTLIEMNEPTNQPTGKRSKWREN